MDARSLVGVGMNEVMVDVYKATRDAITQLYTLAMDQHRLGDRGQLNELGETGGDVSDALTLQTPQHPEYVPAPIGDVQYDPDFPYLDDFQWYQSYLPPSNQLLARYSRGGSLCRMNLETVVEMPLMLLLYKLHSILSMFQRHLETYNMILISPFG